MSQAQCMPMLNMTGTFLSNQILPIKGKWEELKQRRLNVSDLSLAHDEMQGNKLNKPPEETQWQECQARARDTIIDALATTGISQDDEMLSWLQYPVDDSFDRSYCTEVFTPTVNCRGVVTTTGTALNTDRCASMKPGNAEKAMALGAERAAGLISQVGLEAFCKVRTSIQPPVPKWPTGATSTSTTVTTGEIVTEIQPPKNMSSTIPIYSVPTSLRAEKSSGSYVGDSKNVKKESSSCKTKSLENPEPTITSSSGGSENTTEKSEKVQRVAEKRKMVDSLDCQSEDVDGESIDTKKQARPKRSRAAEVHNLSERRRRDRINEKMRALQELIPNSNKTDKASMLDEAIEYLKMLQLQLQMMSMRTGMSMPPVVGIQSMNMSQMPTYPYGMGVGPLMGVPMSGMGISMGSSSSMHSPQQQQPQQLFDTYNTYVSQQQMQLPLQVVSRDMYSPYMLPMGQHQQQQQHIDPQQQQQTQQHQF